jgi:hypothetical protein
MRLCRPPRPDACRDDSLLECAIVRLAPLAMPFAAVVAVALRVLHRVTSGGAR